MSERMFPIIGGEPVPWSILGPHEARAVENHGQSLARLAERGGLSPAEAWCVVNDLPLRTIRTEGHDSLCSKWNARPKEMR